MCCRPIASMPNDVLYGKLEKKFELVRDHFTMDITEGRLELTEYAASIGHNFTDHTQ